MNPILRQIAIALVCSAVSDTYLNVINYGFRGEIMLALRLLRCKNPYAEGILAPISEGYYGNSYIYSNLEGYVADVIDYIGVPDISYAIEVVTSDIEAEVGDYVSGLGDMRSVCISIFNTGELPN